MATMIMDEVDKTYVNGWTENRRDFTFTEHKGLAQAWTTDDDARRAINEACPHPEDAYRLILVPDTLTPVQKAVADLLTISPEARLEVLGLFCRECGGEGCHCRRDLDLA